MSVKVQKTPLIGLADQLKKKLKKDILDYSFEYRNLLRQILDGTGGDPADALRRMRDHIYLDPIKVKNFASYLNDLEGQKHVILLFQNELMPVPKSVNYLTIISLVQESNLNIEEIRNYFAESSIHFHFSFITRRENHFLDIERQLSFESMQMQ
ncbi:MAG: hypothetical protein L6425_11540, partial [Candidatus Aminicenantes bacterium]|nr:hypothetical protein [Candidatus Aminicenantes bacterium]